MRGARRVATLVFAALAIATAFVWPVVAVFAAVVALDCLLGAGENIPFSMYPMFSQPSMRTWALRFEGPDGALVPIGLIGFNPQLAKKRFATEVGTARTLGIADVGEARRHAADVLVTEIHQHDRYQGPWSATPITIVFVEYSVESGELVTTHTPLAQTTPR
jgi:hypothetical protein